MRTENAKPINLNSKKKLKAEIQLQTQEFLARGGQITICADTDTAFPDVKRDFMKKDIFKIKENMERENDNTGNA